MFNIGPQELLLILVLALMVVGPKRLPEIARSVGKGVRELRKAQDEVRKTIQVSLDEPAPRDRGRSGRRLPVDARVDVPVDVPEEPPTPSGPEMAEEEAANESTALEATERDAAPAASGSDAAASAAAASGVSEVSRTLGRTLAELRRAREEVQRSFRVDLDPPAPRPRRTAPDRAPEATSDPGTTVDGPPVADGASAAAAAVNADAAAEPASDAPTAVDPERPS
jgi:Tat protein translocase TatB subunit